MAGGRCGALVHAVARLAGLEVGAVLHDPVGAALLLAALSARPLEDRAPVLALALLLLGAQLDCLRVVLARAIRAPWHTRSISGFETKKRLE